MVGQRAIDDLGKGPLMVRSIAVISMWSLDRSIDSHSIITKEQIELRTVIMQFPLMILHVPESTCAES
jgi:hypothetical protein